MMINSQRLQKWCAENLMRIRKIKQSPEQSTVICNQQPCLSFSSNDYLGLANHPEIITALKQGADQFGFGSGASQVVSGHHVAHQQLECEFAEFLQRDRALFFANGYMANLGVLSAFGDKETTIFQDRQNHASLIDGGQLAQAASRRYLHANLNHLTKYLQLTKTQNNLIVSDSVFSTTGEIAPVRDLCNIAQQFSATLILDDAHGIGVLGDHGAGVTEQFRLNQQNVPIIICPFGKAFGGYGAIVAGSHETIEYLIQFARSYIYTTAPPPALAHALSTSLKIVREDKWRRQKLNELIGHFKLLSQKLGLAFLPSTMPIQALPVTCAATGLHLQEKLLEKGFWVGLLRPPSVDKNQTFLRISLTANHEPAHLNVLLETLSDEYHNIIS